MRHSYSRFYRNITTSGYAIKIVTVCSQNCWNICHQGPSRKTKCTKSPRQVRNESTTPVNVVDLLLWIFKNGDKCFNVHCLYMYSWSTPSIFSDLMPERWSAILKLLLAIFGPLCKIRCPSVNLPVGLGLELVSNGTKIGDLTPALSIGNLSSIVTRIENRKRKWRHKRSKATVSRPTSGPTCPLMTSFPFPVLQVSSLQHN